MPFDELDPKKKQKTIWLCVCNERTDGGQRGQSMLLLGIILSSFFFLPLSNHSLQMALYCKAFNLSPVHLGLLGHKRKPFTSLC